MNLIELSELLLNEDMAEQYLLKTNILKTFTHCEKCNSNRVSKISRGRYRCNACESEWSERKDSILHRLGLSASKLLGIIKLFELEVTAIQTSKELNLPERTTQRMYSKIREAIIGTVFFQDKSAILKGDTLKFSITITDSIVKIDFANNRVIEEDLFTAIRSRVPNKEATFNFIYSKVKSRPIKRRLNKLPVEQSLFWRFANSRLQKFRGTTANNLYLFIKEIEFRYNYQSDLFNELIKKIAVCRLGVTEK